MQVLAIIFGVYIPRAEKESVSATRGKERSSRLRVEGTAGFSSAAELAAGCFQG